MWGKQLQPGSCLPLVNPVSGQEQAVERG
jgi:hypothetical protein